MLQPSRGEGFTSLFHFEEKYSIVDLAEEHLIYVRRTSGYWAMSFDSLEKHIIMVARRAKASSRRTNVVKVELEEPMTCPIRDVCSTFSRSNSSLNRGFDLARSPMATNQQGILLPGQGA